MRTESDEMLRIRLRRVGARGQPSYRIVVADKRAARDGAFVDHLGHYNPRTDPPTVVLDREKAQKWLDVGAQPSDAVRRMLDWTEEPQPDPSADLEQAPPQTEEDDSESDES